MGCGDKGRGPRHRTRGIWAGGGGRVSERGRGVAGPLAYEGDALGLRREERRGQGGCSNVFIGVSLIR